MGKAGPWPCLLWEEQDFFSMYFFGGDVAKRRENKEAKAGVFTIVNHSINYCTVNIIFKFVIFT